MLNLMFLRHTADAAPSPAISSANLIVAFAARNSSWSVYAGVLSLPGVHSALPFSVVENFT